MLIKSLALAPILGIFAIGCVAGSAPTESAPGDDAQFGVASNADSLCVEPLSTPSADGNALVTLAINEQASMPSSLTIQLNGHPFTLVDDGSLGDGVAGDGVYSVIVQAKTVPERKACHEMNGRPNRRLSITFSCQIVDCPEACESIIFGSRCSVCFDCSGGISFDEDQSSDIEDP